MSTHTPLFVGVMNDGLFIIDQPPRPSSDAQFHEREGVNVVAKMAGSDSDALALAHLIAAAPEMFEALQGCISYRNWEIAEGGVVPDQLRDTWKRAEAALSKARPVLTGGTDGQ